MTYELCKQLKEAGFPKHKCPDIGMDEIVCGMCGGGINPTLSELIEACGERFWKLEKRLTCWRAMSMMLSDKKDGNDGLIGCEEFSPEEAVAKLWLELNKKDV